MKETSAMTNVSTGPPPKANGREQQLAAAKALAELMQVDDLPELSWSLSAHNPCLDGIARSDQDDDTKRDDVSFWADFLEADVVEQPGSSEDGRSWTYVIAVGTYSNSRVKVWARVDLKEASK